MMVLRRTSDVQLRVPERTTEQNGEEVASYHLDCQRADEWLLNEDEKTDRQASNPLVCSVIKTRDSHLLEKPPEHVPQ